MDRNSAKKFISELLQSAGIQINGPAPWDIQVQHDGFYQRVLANPTLGLGEAYMENWWHCPRLEDFIYRVLRANLENKIKENKRLAINFTLAKILNLQTKTRAKEVGRKHYDLHPDLFKAMLDSRLNYTCGYWKNANTLEQAQLDKLDLTCKKLNLKPGMRLLDIGCGWGALVKHAAEHYGVNAVGITISRQQHQEAKELCKYLPIEIRLQDYRDVNESFDRIVSLGMFEHVGHLNYATYMKIVHRCLTDDGLFLLHTIGSDIKTYKANDWITKYIFPNGMLPSISQIGEAADSLFCMEDWHNFGADYANTLLAWHANFQAHWPSIKHHFDDRFYAMWNFYLLSCAGAFRARNLQLWQIVFSKMGVVEGYQGIR